MEGTSAAEKRAGRSGAASPRVADAENKTTKGGTAQPQFRGCDYARLVRSFDREMEDSARLIEERIQAMRDLYLQAVKVSGVVVRRA